MRRYLRGLRLWPAYLVLLAGAGLQVWCWWKDEPTRQHRVMNSLSFGVLTLAALLLWLLLFSRLSARLRWRLLGGLALLAVLGFSLVEIRGVSGDLVPILAWRFQGELDEAPVASPDGPRAVATAGDFPQFLGPRLDARLPGVFLHRDWQSHPPREVWRRAVGAGWSGFAVAGDLALTQEQRGEEEMVVAYALATGDPVWSHGDRARYDATIGGVGPRATPTVAGGRVFTVGSTGLLNALDLATGRQLWGHDLVAELGAEIPSWGKSSSPLVLENRVFVPVGGSGKSLVAFDAADGRELWRGGDDGASYSSPLVAELAGRRQIVLFTAASVTGQDPESGRVLWRHPWSAGQPNVAQPIVLGPDRLLVSSGYGIGASLLELSSGEGEGLVARELWHSPRLKLKFSQAVEHDGRLFGLDDGVFTCLDPSSGERCFKRGRYGHGQLLLVGDLLLVQTEAGELLLVEPDAAEARELGRIDTLSGHAWNTLAFSPPYLLLRNHQEAVCYELALAGEEAV
ncbi:MAG: PQQ-like beta-propeller repeat protein [Acidobacteria bacterium]|nr:PQQ-like beta-propeller repeat protein [Acidobacteriota bacterium]